MTTSEIEKTDADAPSPNEVRESNLKVYDRILATISILGIVFGGIWGFYSHLQQRVAEAKQSEKQKLAEAKQKDEEIQLRKHELDLLIFQEKKDAYYALCDAACDIVACRNRKEVEERSRVFLKMYFGRAHIIAEADSAVSKKKIDFKNRLMSYLDGEDKASTEAPFDYFGEYAFELTKACKKHVDPRQLATLESAPVASPAALPSGE